MMTGAAAAVVLEDETSSPRKDRAAGAGSDGSIEMMDTFAKALSTKVIEGGFLPWRRPWNAGRLIEVPVNAASGNAYGVANAIVMYEAMRTRRFTRLAWCTEGEAASTYGASLKEHERDRGVVTLNPRRHVGRDGESEEVIDEITVYNLDQFSIGRDVDLGGSEVRDQDLGSALDEMARVMTERTRLEIFSGSSSIWCNARGNRIWVPETFEHGAGWSAEFAKALVEASAHPYRTGRLERTRALFGDVLDEKALAGFEALAVELATSALLAKFGRINVLSIDERDIALWCEGMANVPGYLFEAARAASRASWYLDTIRSSVTRSSIGRGETGLPIAWRMGEHVDTAPEWAVQAPLHDEAVGF